MFLCNQCGECCKHLKDLPYAADLDRGDGICKHLNEANNRCNIYKDRPLKCNVDQAYAVFYQDIYPREAYERMNYEMCRLLQQAR